MVDVAVEEMRDEYFKRIPELEAYMEREEEAEEITSEDTKEISEVKETEEEEYSWD